MYMSIIALIKGFGENDNAKLKGVNCVLRILYSHLITISLLSLLTVASDAVLLT